MRDRFLSALSLCQKAGALAVGFDAAKDAARRKTAVAAFVCSDVSEGTRRRLHTVCAGGCPIYPIPYKSGQLADVCRKTVGVLAVTDRNLAGLCLKTLPRVTSEEEQD